MTFKKLSISNPPTTVLSIFKIQFNFCANNTFEYHDFEFIYGSSGIVPILIVVSWSSTRLGFIENRFLSWLIRWAKSFVCAFDCASLSRPFHRDSKSWIKPNGLHQCWRRFILAATLRCWWPILFIEKVTNISYLHKLCDKNYVT